MASIQRMIRLWVLAPPGASYLKHLERAEFPKHRFESIVIGDALDTFASVDDPHVVLVAMDRRIGGIFQDLWPRMTSCSWVHSLSAGLDHGIIHPRFTDSDIVLTNAKGVFGPSLGEYTIAACLHFSKSMRTLIDNQRKRVWDPFIMDELRGRTLGIVGLGGIGINAAQRARAFGMRVIAYRRHPEKSAGQEEEIFGPDRLDDLISQSDYLLISAPLTPETRGLISAERIAKMKPSSVLINLGRGPIVDEEALITALRENRIKGAALDVFNTEPLPEDHPFWTLENVLLSPHNADRTSDCFELAFLKFFENLNYFLEGQPLPFDNIVNKKLGY